MTKPTLIYKAEYTTQRYRFEAIGSSTEEAHDALVQALEAHARDYGLKPNWWSILIQTSGEDLLQIAAFELNAIGLRNNQTVNA